jgi:2-oxoglutarate ferredoxin oxidoreductase subunit alpha
MASFDAETIFRHFNEVPKDGGIIYDSDLDKTTTDEVLTLDNYFKARLHKELESKNKPFTIAGALEIAKEKGVHLYPVSFREILSNLAEKTENPKLKGLVRLFNVLAVSLSLGLIKMPLDPLLQSVNSIFSKKPQIAEINKQAANFAYDYAKSKFSDFQYALTGTTKQPDTILVQGHFGTSIGKMVSGCRFQSYYPITPASDESVYLESHELLEIHNDRPGSTIVIQTEDEISAMGMMIGAALTGTRSCQEIVWFQSNQILDVAADSDWSVV